MNKNAIQKFAIWARNELIAQVSQRAYQYGIDESGFGDASADTLNGRLLTEEEKSQRQELIKQIKEKGYKQVMEEVAYTWFNRFIALRFMEVNNYLPSHIRVFSDASGAFKPEILNDVLHLDLPGLDSGKVAEYIESNGTEALYRYLLLTQCNALNSALPVMFERMGGYTEMLLPNNILRQDSVLGHMVSDIPEEDWQDAVQIIGWLYQYYNTELKDDTFAQLKKNVKITKERIPAATQLFTPDWIVRYMVENSLGRLWLEGHPNAELRGGWKYYLDEAKQGPEVETQLTKLREEYKTIKPEEIKVIDPCMGSGHILVYAFDVLMQIYTSAGWDQREAAQSILKNNLYGLDIDDRAAQLAYFAVMMKARQYDRRLLTRGIQPNVYSIRESIGINRNQLKFFGWSMSEVERNTALTQLEYLLDTFRDAKEYGSILNVDMLDWGLLYRFVGTVDYSDQISMDELNLEDTKDALWNLVELGAVLAQKYDVVCTNPPYMGIANLGGMLYDYIQAQFDAFKQDLYCVFVEKCRKLLKKNGIQSLITQQSFMFNSRFENMREALINASAFVNMIYLGTKAFDEISGEKVRTCAYVIQNIRLPEYISYYIDLQEQESELSKEQAFLSIANVRNVSNCNRYTAKLMDFEKLDGKTFSFWISSAVIDNMAQQKKLEAFAETRHGLVTGNGDLFMRFWFECSSENLAISGKSNNRSMKWFPYSKGGTFRKWYGNRDYVVNWFDNGAAIRNYTVAGKIKSSNYNINFNFRKNISWSDIKSGNFSARYTPSGALFDTSGPSLFVKKDDSLEFILGLLNTSPIQKFLDVSCTGLHYSTGAVSNLPIKTGDAEEKVSKLARINISISRTDWDSYETSWDFKRNPLV